MHFVAVKEMRLAKQVALTVQKGGQETRMATVKKPYLLLQAVPLTFHNEAAFYLRRWGNEILSNSTSLCWLRHPYRSDVCNDGNEKLPRFCEGWGNPTNQNCRQTAPSNLSKGGLDRRSQGEGRIRAASFTLMAFLLAGCVQRHCYIGPMINPQCDALQRLDMAHAGDIDCYHLGVGCSV